MARRLLALFFLALGVSTLVLFTLQAQAAFAGTPAGQSKSVAAQSATGTPTTRAAQEPTPTLLIQYPEATPIPGVAIITATGQTENLLDIDLYDNYEQFGDADDPAIWIHPEDASKSLIVTAEKDGGLGVYDLEGNLLQNYHESGDIRYNNVDLIYGFPLAGKPTDIFVFTDRANDLLAIWSIDPETGELTNVTDPESTFVFNKTAEETEEQLNVYGVATYVSPKTGKYYAFTPQRHALPVAQLELSDVGGKVGWKTVRTFNMPEPGANDDEENLNTEGMVVDAEYGILYLGQENTGIYKISAEPDGGDKVTLVDATTPDGEHLTADVEGLTLYYGPDGTGYLLASSQGDSTYVVYERTGDNKYLGNFQIQHVELAEDEDEQDVIDGVNDSDGAMVTNVALPPLFPKGLLVTQDGLAYPAVLVYDEGELENENNNFKFTPWEHIANSFVPPLIIDTSFNPREPENRMQ